MRQNFLPEIKQICVFKNGRIKIRGQIFHQIYLAKLALIDIIDEEQTIEVYKKYEKLYEEKDHRIYCHEYYEDFQPDVTTLEYLKKCLLTYGIIDAEEFLKQKLRPNELEKIKKYGLMHKQPAQ